MTGLRSSKAPESSESGEGPLLVHGEGLLSVVTSTVSEMGVSPGFLLRGS